MKYRSYILVLIILYNIYVYIYIYIIDDIQLHIELPVIANSYDNVVLIDCINMVKIGFYKIA